MPFCHLGHERQPVAKALRAGGGGAAEKALEDALAVGVGDALAAVFNFEHGVVAALFDGDADGAAGVLQGVADEIVDNALDEDRIGDRKSTRLNSSHVGPISYAVF